MRNDRVVDFQQQRRTLSDCAFRVDLSLACSVHGDLRIPMGKLSDCSATRKGESRNIQGIGAASYFF